MWFKKWQNFVVRIPSDQPIDSNKVLDDEIDDTEPVHPGPVDNRQLLESKNEYIHN